MRLCLNMSESCRLQQVPGQMCVGACTRGAACTKLMPAFDQHSGIRRAMLVWSRLNLHHMGLDLHHIITTSTWSLTLHLMALTAR